MRVVALSPVHVASVVWRRDARTWMLTAVCKASFDLVPGEMRLSAQQDVINEADQRWEDDPQRSVHAPGDLAPFKPLADVTVVGNAFAPGGKATRSLVTRLVVGNVDKAIAVFGDRPRPGHPEPATFTRMPLRFERAAGGPGTTNPVGTPERPPNLEPARRGEGPVPPIGYGPIAPDWPERRAKLGSHASWAPHEPFPEDIDATYFNVAPADQQLTALRNDQQIHLEHLHPEHARLTTRLPGMYPQAFVERGGVVPHEIEMRADGLWIDTDRGRCAVTWRAQIPLASPDEPGRVLIAMVSPRQQLTWDDAVRLDAALHGGQEPQKARGPFNVPRVGMDDDDDDQAFTAVTRNQGKVVPAQQPVAQPPQQAPVPTIVPPLPPVPQPKRTATLQGVPPADARGLRPDKPGYAPEPPRRPTIQPVEAAPPPPPPPRPSIDSEPTNTELFVMGENAPLFDNAPAWLAPNSQRPRVEELLPEPPPAPPAPIPQPVATPTAEATSAEARSPWAAGTPVTTVAPALPITPAAAPVTEARPAPAPLRSPQVDDIIDLLWFDPEAVPRIRARWPRIIDELEFEPLDPRHDLPVDDPAASRDRHHVFGVLTRAESTDPRAIAREMMEAIGDHGRFTPPLLVISGELRFPIDEIEMLKAAAAAAKPLAKDDKRLTDLLEMIAELIDTPLLQGSPGAVDSLLRDLTSAIQQSKRPLPVKYLDAHLERVLLEKRRYQRRTVLGGPCIRALLGQGSSAVPAYLPDSLADRLPLVTTMRARLLAEASASQDQYESHPHALKVVALGRVVGLDGSRR
jgi:hypothetical protein